MTAHSDTILLGRSQIRVGRLGWGMWRLTDSGVNARAVTERVVAAVDAGGVGCGLQLRDALFQQRGSGIGCTGRWHSECTQVGQQKEADQSN